MAYYRTSVVNGQTVVIKINDDGTRLKVNSLPTGLSSARKGSMVRIGYTPEAAHVFNPAQFGTGKYFSPTFRFTQCHNPNDDALATRKGYGINLFSAFELTEAEKVTLLPGEGLLYLTESGPLGDYEGWRGYQVTLAEFEARLWANLPVCGVPVLDQSGANINTSYGFTIIALDIETTLFFNRERFDGSRGWPAWDSVKDQRLVLESTGQNQSMSLSEMNAAGLFGAEDAVRTANRIMLIMKVLKLKAQQAAAGAGIPTPALKIAFGPSMYQGEPRIDHRNGQAFLPYTADVSHVGGSSGSITLNGRTYPGMNISPWQEQNITWGYWYESVYDMSGSDYQDIYVDKKAGTQTYPYLWSKIKRVDVGAQEKGYIQLNRALSQRDYGKKEPMYRMAEHRYEDGRCNVDGILRPGQVPFAQLAGTFAGGETPKVWQPPYHFYDRYIWTRLFAGNEDGWGWMTFPDSPDIIRVNGPFYNHHQHTATATLQARHDLQPYEQFWTGTTLIEDPEVKVGEAGDFSSYDGTDAHNMNGGVYGPKKPAYSFRFKDTEDGLGWRVVLVGSFDQDTTAEHIDLVRAPGGGLNGNIMRVKLRGYTTHVFDFVISKADTNQTYEAVFTFDANNELPAYAGRINPSTT